MAFTLLSECLPSKDASSPGTAGLCMPSPGITFQVITRRVIVCHVSLHDIVSSESTPC